MLNLGAGIAKTEWICDSVWPTGRLTVVPQDLGTAVTVAPGGYVGRWAN